MENETSTPEWVYDTVTTILYTVLIGIQVSMILDEMTNGAFSRQCGQKWDAVKASWREHRRIEFAFRKSAPVVLFEATEIVGHA